jgi:hypothetical protein
MLIVGSSEFNGNTETVHNEERQTQRQVVSSSCGAS